MNAILKQLFIFNIIVSILFAMYMLATLDIKWNKNIQNYLYLQVSTSTTKMQSHMTAKNMNKSSTAPKERNFAPKVADISEELLNPKSPFYCMIYKESYGLPLSNQERQNYKEVYHDWKDYFPSLVASIEKSVKENPTRNVKLFTKTASINLNKTEFRFGQEFVAIITSIDGEGRAKKFGGDYYRARLIRGNTKNPDGIPCRIIDNGDGTYTAKAPLLLEGHLKFDVVLSLSFGAILEVIDQIRKGICDHDMYSARLNSGQSVGCSFSYEW